MSGIFAKSIIFVITCVIAVVGWFFWSVNAQEDSPSYRTETVARRDVVATISASGTIEPEEIVDVGAQVAGKIVSFGQAEESTSMIDYGSVVEPGTVLARIDDALFREEVELAKADLAQAKAQLAQTLASLLGAAANVKKSEADLQNQKSRLTQVQRESRRIESLRAQNAASQQDADNAASLLEQSIALHAVAEATLAQTRAAHETMQSTVSEREAAVSRGEALLRKAETNLGYATIKSPIRGVIVDRRVNIGQTVVSNLNAPSLFLIAKDLRRMEVWASVNEADIGSIRNDMPVEFTVDAFPNETFRGTVKQIRLNATMNQSVVTYTVVVAVDNSEGKLLPYLTANLRFVVADRKQVVTVPGAALRWKPKKGNAPAKGSPSEPKKAKGPEEIAVWVLDAGTPKKVPLKTGASNGLFVEVTDGDLPENAEVIVGEAMVRKQNFKNPFSPSLTQGLER